MRKLLAILIVCILVLGGLGAVAKTDDKKSKTELIDISEPMISNSDQFFKIDLKESTSTFLDPGKPEIPVIKRIFTFPFGTKISNVDVVFSDINEMSLSKKIKPSPEPSIPGVIQFVTQSTMDETIYNSANLYPESWFIYDIGSGLIDGKHKVILNVQVFPVRYSPLENKILYAPEGEIKISYEEPKEPLLTSNDAYDLLIISANQFYGAMEEYVEHKESHGIRTKMVLLDDAIFQANDFPITGRDNAEKVKYYIKNAIEEWGIKYVLLVGGRKPGLQERWHFPVRYIHVFWADEYFYMSDLYFADIYDGEGQFSSWDTDENDVFGEWGRMGSLKDEMDLYPDVYIGRWAVQNKLEVKLMIHKSIDYENSQTSKNIVLVGGDNFDPDGYEGNIVCDKTLSYLSGYSNEKIYSSEMDVNAQAIRSAIERGSTFAHFHGHASPISWSTHKPENFNEWEDGLVVYDYPLFSNDEYTIAVFGGCHTAMFNVSLTNHPWLGSIGSPQDLSWWFVRKIGGGGIAALGYTCFPVATPGEEGDLDGDGINDPDCAESGYGYMQLEIFYAYGQEGKQLLGDCWGYAVSKYSDAFKIPDQRYHLHTITGFVILGDPTLKIGGYGSASGFNVKIDGSKGYPNVPIELHASASKGQQPYSFVWDLDEDGIYDDATGETIEWIWSKTGIYPVSVKATDANNKERIYTSIISIEAKPQKPTGPSSSKPGQNNTFSAVINADTSWDQIYYYIDWGDGTYDKTKDPCNSGEKVDFYHTWRNSGSYKIRVKGLLMDSESETFEETAWSDPLEISISKSRQYNNPLLQKLISWLSQFEILNKIFEL